MIFMKRNIFILAFLQILFAPHIQSQERQDWEEQFEELKTLPLPEDVKKLVLHDLWEWNPKNTNSYLHIPLWFWDAYLEDEALKSLVRAYFFSSFTNNCYELIIGQTLECPLDAIAHTAEIGRGVLGVMMSLGYSMYPENHSDIFANFTWKSSIRSCTALISHWSAALGSTCTRSSGAYPGDPAGWLAMVLTAQVFKMASFAFGAASAYLALDKEFIDVALRCIKRNYEMQNRLEESAAVSMMLAHRNRVKDK
jgi:hypothetical protein